MILMMVCFGDDILRASVSRLSEILETPDPETLETLEIIFDVSFGVV